jgi:hypothetical protein
VYPVLHAFPFEVILFDGEIARLASMATAIDCNSGYAGYANFGGLLCLGLPTRAPPIAPAKPDVEEEYLMM